jgi:hypothetical protein
MPSPRRWRHSCSIRRRGERKRQDESDGREKIERIISQAVEETDWLSDWLVTVWTLCLVNWLESEECCARLKKIAYSDDGDYGLQVEQAV